MAGGERTPSRLAPGHRDATWTIWALHDRVGRWMPIVRGMNGPNAVTELTVRQDRLRRTDEPCRLVLLEDGKEPR